MKFMFYSAPGVGKTYLIGTSVLKDGKGSTPDPRLCPLLLIDFEGGTMPIASKIRNITLEDLSSPDFKPGKLIDVVRVRAWDDFNIIYSYLMDHPNAYKAVALDSLSEVNYLNLKSAVDYEKAQSSRHDPDIPEQRDYLRSSTQMRRLVRAFRDLPMVVIFTAHAKEEKDARTGLGQLRPNLVGKLPQELPGMLDVLGYLYVTQTKDDKTGEVTYTRVLDCQPSEYLMAKDRSEGGKLGALISNPTLPQLLDLISP